MYMDIWSMLLESVNSFYRMLIPSDIIDLIIVAYLMYKGIKLVQDTRAESLIKGILILLLIMQVSHWLQLNTINFILKNTMQVGFVAIIVVFQPELRKALETVGRSSFGNLRSSEAGSVEEYVAPVAEAMGNLSSRHIGALVVFERESKISEIIRTGTEIDSKISAELLINIFMANTPLHDGAVVIRDGRLMAAACLLPLSSNENLSRELGTRHRSALGMSETCDALVVVVSEETGKISLAQGGSLTRSLTPESLSKALIKALTPKDFKEHKFLAWSKADPKQL